MKKESNIEKVDFSKYEGRYDSSINSRLVSSPEEIGIEALRCYIYGYTFTEDYAKGVFPKEMSLDYWSSNESAQCDLFSGNILLNNKDENINEEVWDYGDDESFVVIDEILDATFDESMSIMFDDTYFVETMQERCILQAIDSTGDGKTRETALCVIDVGQEYEYLARVYPYCMLTVVRQTLEEGIDCLEFAENEYGIERIYFDIHRRVEVGYLWLKDSH